ncbi:MAG TPA: DUF4902 domain-containing protein [Burkholderiaceae bacterium]|jgi:hypothetical protein|nr:DUF4902 domain-containing protein [Burkholderiaceae bacterium]
MVLSPDGYVRLPFGQLASLRLVHLISGLDGDAVALPGPGQAPVTGYTEWLGEGEPAVTVGWDWCMARDGEGWTLTLVGEPRSNVMLQDSCQLDLGPVATAMLLAKLVDAAPWQATVADYLALRYR